MTKNMQTPPCMEAVSLRQVTEDGRDYVVPIRVEIPIDGTLLMRVRRQQVTVEEEG